MPTLSRESQALLFLALVLGGVGVASYGYGELSLGEGSSAQPVSAKLEEFHRVALGPNRHLSIGPHQCLYFACAYEARVDGSPPRITPESTVKHVFYPILSLCHPFVKDLAELERKYGGLDRVPEDVPWPDLESCLVIVKSTRFAKVKDIPPDVGKRDSVEGMVMRHGTDRSAPIPPGLRAMVEDHFTKKLDWSRVVILEEGRRPMSSFLGYVVITLGLLMLVAPIPIMILRRVAAR